MNIQPCRRAPGRSPEAHLWASPSSLQPCLTPCQNQELFHPNLLRAVFLSVPGAGWIRSTAVYFSLFSPGLPIRALLKMGVEGLSKKPNSTPRAPAQQQILCIHHYPHFRAEERDTGSQVMIIIRLSTYCVPGPKLRALPCLLICHNHAVIREVLSLLYRGRR